MTGAMVHDALFYVLAAGAVLFALLVVSTRRMLRAAVYLMLVLLLTAGLYGELGSEFLAAIQILVYIGGVVAVMVFVILLTDSVDKRDNPAPRRRRVAAALASLAFLGLSSVAVLSTDFPVAAGDPVREPARAIGAAFLDRGSGGWLLPFELVSLLLLAAVIGGIVIARKTPAPGQPLTSGGDLPGEVREVRSKSQREHAAPGGPHA